MNRGAHRDDVRRFAIGVVTVTIGLLIAYVGVTVQGGGKLPLKKYTDVRADFATVGTLKPQQKVTVKGVRVGVVSDIEYVDGHARVTLRLDGDRDVYRDATARVGNESALGKKYVDLDPGTAAAGELGSAPIPVERTTDPSSLDDVLAGFDKPARQGLQSTLRSVGGGLLGHGQDLQDIGAVAPDLLDKGEAVVSTLADPRTDLDDLLVNAESLTSQFDGQSERLARLLDEGATTMAALDVDGGAPLRETLRTLPGTLETARAGLKEINDPLLTTASAVEELNPGVRRLVQATPDLRGFLVESPPVARTVIRFTRKAEPAVKELNPAVKDLRPVVDRATRTITLAEPLLTTLVPYWPDAGRLFSHHDLLSGRFAKDRHFFSAMLNFPGLHTVSVLDPLADVDPYPGPGRAFDN
ncbi:MlaD family protein [Nocardioides daeguensis]|uniref:Mce/MlaD domain-containing protein n=1 Tax=Nocardioides daeguensis TaxID=908359 RepID=A0ABP6V8A8_9ACTN|nr:MlaD family protein [Nocardioides daeguensis]MBV6726507.1 MCE family protein [Nocardioides daeguensis]MCR1772350.1 MCE family protein [Nocardioides daeguensis]